MVSFGKVPLHFFGIGTCHSNTSKVQGREREGLFIVPLVWWTTRSHKAQPSHASTTAPPLPVIWIVPSQAPALYIYRAVRGKVQIYRYTQGLWLQQGKLKSQSTLYGSMYIPPSLPMISNCLHSKKKFKVHHLQSSSRLTVISRVVENREQRRQPRAFSLGHKQCTQQLWKSFSASYAYWCYPSNSERERNEVKTSCIYKKQSALPTGTKGSWRGKGKQNS